MKWLLLFLLYFNCISSVAIATEQPSAAQQLQFRQALTSPAAQYSQALLTEAYNRLGINASFVDVPFGRSLLESNKGTLDGEIARILRVTNQYSNLIAVPYVLFDTDVYLYINQQRCRNCTLKTVPSLAFVRGSVVVEDLLKKLPASRQVIGSGTIDTTKNLFFSGKVDAVIFAAYRLTPPTNFDMSEQSIMSLPDYHLLHRNHQALLKPLADMLFQLEREGFTARLRSHYDIPAPRRQLRPGQPPFAEY